VRIDFDWDPTRRRPTRSSTAAVKHGITFDEAMTVFRDRLARSVLDRDYGPDKERWVTLGQAATGNLLMVVHTWLETDPDRSVVRIISARRPTPKEAQCREDPMP
jgi:uncharacterized DUF497 family protein